MTAPWTPWSEPPGEVESPMRIGSKEFAEACRRIVEGLDGEAAHRALDFLVTALLTNLGYGEGMKIFIDQVRSRHTEA